MPSISRARLLAGTSAVALGTLARPFPASAQSVVPLRVGAGLIEANAEVHYATDMGFFKANGLDVATVTSNNGAASASAVAGGDLQIAVISLIGFTLAVNLGLPFSIIVPGGVYDSSVPGSGLVVASTSAYVNAKALNGKTIGVSVLKGLDQLLSSVLVDKNGGDSSTLKFVEVTPPTMVEALNLGRIDAAYIDNPEFSLAKTRARVLGDGEAAIANSFVETVWFASRDWLAKNGDVARRFRESIYTAGDWAMANPDRAGTILQAHLKVDQPKATQHFATKKATTPASYQVLLDAAAKYGVLPPTNIKDLLWTG